jgi:hypothetical protein
MGSVIFMSPVTKPRKTRKPKKPVPLLALLPEPVFEEPGKLPPSSIYEGVIHITDTLEKVAASQRGQWIRLTDATRDFDSAVATAAYLRKCVKWLRDADLITLPVTVGVKPFWAQAAVHETYVMKPPYRGYHAVFMQIKDLPVPPIEQDPVKAMRDAL